MSGVYTHIRNMSAGGVFTLIANDGKADRMIMATELLNKRMDDIKCAKQKMGFEDPMPTLSDIEKTHMLFVNAHFKPYAAVGFEYNKVRVQSGNLAYDNSVQFNIPNFGDFFHDMVVHTILDQVGATNGVVPAFPSYIGMADQATTSTKSVSATTNATDGIYTRYTYEYVNSAGDVLTVGATAKNYVRYCEFPGERLFPKVKFEVNGNPLDEYTSDVVVFHRKYKIAPNKMTGWKRIMGQEIAIEAVSDLSTHSGSKQFNSSMSDLVNIDGKIAGASAITKTDTSRKVVQLLNGPQTPQLLQPKLELWVPLLFWFCRDIRLAIPSVSIPFGQRFISISTARQDEMVFTAPGDLYLRLTTEVITATGTGKGTLAAIAVTGVKRYVRKEPVLASGSLVDSTQKIMTMDIYINNIFMNTEIHDIYIRRIGFSLIRVHREHRHTTSATTDQVLMSSLKWPTEYLFVGLRPSYNNKDAANLNQYKDWHQFSAFTEHSVDVIANSHASVSIDDTANISAASFKQSFSSELVERYNYSEPVETVDELHVQVHGVSIYNTANASFYRDYLTYTYGGANLNCPEDKGALFINFCLYPGTYQPSGHINISRAREFYITFKSSYIGVATPCEMVVVASAINFLLISDGSAVLRYTT